MSKFTHLIKKWADGAVIQVQEPSGSWTDLGLPGEDQQPSWLEDFEYRVKPVSVVYASVTSFSSGTLVVGTTGSRDEVVEDNPQADRILRLEINPDTLELISATMEMP